MTPIETILEARERFYERVIPGPACWVWTGIMTNKGYGFFYMNGKRRLAHRVAYQIWRDPISSVDHLDHTCHDPDVCGGGPSCVHRSCVNPWHLQVVTLKENVLRGGGITAQNARKTHCSVGHPLDGPNLYVYRGQRRCKACRNQRTKEWNQRRRARD